MRMHEALTVSWACAVAANIDSFAQPQGCQISKLDQNPGYHEQRGQAVAVGGSHVLVGFPGEVDLPSWGAAYFYSELGGRCLEDQVVWPTTATHGIGFGLSVTMDDKSRIALVGAMADTTEPGVIDGSVYVYENTQSGWSHIDTLRATQPDAIDSLYEFFGCAVAIDGDTILVGARNDHSAYVFDRDGTGNWTQSARLTPTPPSAQFGRSVALRNNIAVVGAPDDFSQGNYAGAAFIFERDGEGHWTQTARLLPHPGGLQRCGWSVATNGEVVMVGAIGNSIQAPSAGTVYVFDRMDGAWSLRQLLFPPDPENSDFFGSSLAIDGDMALIGAENYGAGHSGPGAAFVVQRQSDSTWQLAGTLTANDAQLGSEFGRTVALSGRLAVVGAPLQMEDGLENAGAAYVFAVSPDADGDGIMDICECRRRGDLNMSGHVELADLALLLSSFEVDDAGDLDGDGYTFLTDIEQMLNHFGEACE